jgi:hypothetical protein
MVEANLQDMEVTMNELHAAISAVVAATGRLRARNRTLQAWAVRFPPGPCERFDADVTCAECLPCRVRAILAR